MPLSCRALLCYAGVVMLDPRWPGASGQGAYWAVACRHANEWATAGTASTFAADDW